MVEVKERRRRKGRSRKEMRREGGKMEVEKETEKGKNNGSLNMFNNQCFVR